ncbi:MAG: DUF1073 domain-containing protein, partial [Clostridiales bacterium]|nr:DUF1073 domain-containing protein [Clostridiales bacterium]
RELPWQERIAESHWGQSEIEAIYDEIVKRDNVSYNLASLTFRANVNVQEMDNVDQLFALGGASEQRRFWDVLQAQSVLESNLGTRIINRGDKVHQLQYSFAGLPEVYDAMMMDVAGAARIPVTKLFGRSPAGMNSTGESDLQNYYDYVEQKREFEFRPIIEKLLPVMALSAWGELPDGLDFSFESLRTPTEAEKAEIAHKKTLAVIEAFNANGLTQGALMRELKALSEQGGGIFSSITDEMIAEGEGVWAKDIQELSDPMMGLAGMREEPGETDGQEEPDAREIPGGRGEPDGQEEPEGRRGGRPGTARDGGPGSGNFGHAGRPGEMGGSGDGGGKTSGAEKRRKIDSVKIDFGNDNVLPELNKEDLAELGKPSKPVLLKKTVIDRNIAYHPEVAPRDYARIIGQALYDSDLRFGGDPRKHSDDYINFVKLAPHRNSLTLLELANHKENYEIVHFFEVGDRSLERIKKR